MKPVLMMLAAGLFCAAPVFAQQSGGKSEGKSVVDDSHDTLKEMEKALEDVLKDKETPKELRDALEKTLKELREAAKKAKDAPDGEEVIEETLPDGTKVKVRISRKTSRSESTEKEDKAEGGEKRDLPDEVKRLREELRKLQEEIDRKIEKELEGGDGESTETIEKVLPDGTRIKIVKSVSRKTGGGAPKNEEPKKEEPNKQ